MVVLTFLCWSSRLVECFLFPPYSCSPILQGISVTVAMDVLYDQLRRPRREDSSLYVDGRRFI